MKPLQELLRRHAALTAAVLLCLAHVASFDIFRQPIITDVRFFLYFAWRISEGAVPHLTYFENKTQLAAFAGALFHTLGQGVGMDPLIAIRAGYLALTAAGGVAVFFIFRRLGGGNGVAGVLGVLAYCTFGLLGLLPATGNIPKLLMAVAASFAALAVARERWVWGGVAGALSFMDWQIGGLAWAGVFAAAVLYGKPRWRAALLVAAGGAAGLAPFVVYYAVHGALGAALGQVIGSSMFRGTNALAHVGLDQRLDKIWSTVAAACGPQTWLFYAGLGGASVVVWWLWRWRRDDRSRMLVVLATYHLGVVAFSLVDFQAFGDLFVLLHSVAFLLGAIWLAAYRVVPELPGAPRWAVPALALALAVILARPGALRPPLELKTPIARPGATLADQRVVARKLLGRLGEGARAAALAHSELLFLTRMENELPTVYLNMASWPWFRDSEEEAFRDTAQRMMLSVDADLFVPPRWLGYDAFVQRGYDVVRLMSDNGLYSVIVVVRPARATACIRIPSCDTPPGSC